MAILPEGSTITFTISASSIDEELVVETASVKRTTEKFDRQEFSNSKLKDLRSSNGNSPIYQDNIVKNIIQYVYVGPCGDSEVRATGVDDDNVGLVKKKFVKRIWRLSGGPSDPESVDILEVVSLDHAKRLARFEGYQELISMDNLSYQLIKGLRDEDFSYLTTTGLTMTGVSVGSEDNLLITDFESEVMYRSTIDNSIVAKSWSMSLEQRTIESIFSG